MGKEDVKDHYTSYTSYTFCFFIKQDMGKEDVKDHYTSYTSYTFCFFIKQDMGIDLKEIVENTKKGGFKPQEIGIKGYG